MTKQTNKQIIDTLCNIYKCKPKDLIGKATYSLVMDRCFCDKPEDRLWHAADKTWWRRNKKGRLVSAFSPLINELNDKPYYQ